MKKAAAKERDAAKVEAAKVKFAAIQAKDDAELAANKAAAKPVTTRVVREEIMSLAALLIRWKETTSDNSDVAELQEGIYKATMKLISEDTTLKVCTAF